MEWFYFPENNLYFLFVIIFEARKKWVFRSLTNFRLIERWGKFNLLECLKVKNNGWNEF